MDQRSNHHSVHRIVLPSGRRIEVVRFHDDGKRTESRPLHICPDCSSPLVQPLSWSETDDDRWVLLLSCPNCEWSTEDLCNQREVEELEDQLEDGLTEMLADLHRLAQANMADEIDRFVSGLQANLILPEDF